MLDLKSGGTADVRELLARAAQRIDAGVLERDLAIERPDFGARNEQAVASERRAARNDFGVFRRWIESAKKLASAAQQNQGIAHTP